MTSKRDDSDRIDISSRPDLTPTVSQVLRAVDEAAKVNFKPAATDDQRMSLFWRVFGGTILSIVALVTITVFNNVMSSLSELRAELTKANEARATAVNDLRAEIARGADARAELVRKDEFNTRVTTAWTEVRAVQGQASQQAAALTSLKAELDGLKERLAPLTAEFAAAREAAQKLRDEVKDNRAADQERKDRRDALQKQTEDAIKELAKAVQDCREKLARLEGATAPPKKPMGE